MNETLRGAPKRTRVSCHGGSADGTVCHASCLGRSRAETRGSRAEARDEPACASRAIDTPRRALPTRAPPRSSATGNREAMRDGRVSERRRGGV